MFIKVERNIFYINYHLSLFCDIIICVFSFKILFSKSRVTNHIPYRTNERIWRFVSSVCLSSWLFPHLYPTFKHGWSTFILVSALSYGQQLLSPIINQIGLTSAT